MLSVTVTRRTPTEYHASTGNHYSDALGREMTLNKVSLWYNLCHEASVDLLHRIDINPEAGKPCPRKLQTLLISMCEVAITGGVAVTPGVRTFVKKNKVGLEQSHLDSIFEAWPIAHVEGVDADDFLRALGLPEDLVVELEPRLLEPKAGLAVLETFLSYLNVDALTKPKSTALVVYPGHDLGSSSAIEPASGSDKAHDLLAELSPIIKKTAALAEQNAAGIGRVKMSIDTGFSQQQANWLADRDQKLADDEAKALKELEDEEKAAAAKRAKVLAELEEKKRLHLFQKQSLAQGEQILAQGEQLSATIKTNHDANMAAHVETQEVVVDWGKSTTELINTQSLSAQILLKEVVEHFDGNVEGSVVEAYIKSLIDLLGRSKTPLLKTLAEVSEDELLHVSVDKSVSSASIASAKSAGSVSTLELPSENAPDNVATPAAAKSSKAKAKAKAKPEAPKGAAFSAVSSDAPAVQKIVTKVHFSAVESMPIAEIAALLELPPTSEEAADKLPLILAAMFSRIPHALVNESAPKAIKMLSLLGPAIGVQLSSPRPIVIAAALNTLKHFLSFGQRVGQDASAAVAIVFNRNLRKMFDIVGSKGASAFTGASATTSTCELAAELMLSCARQYSALFDSLLLLTILKDKDAQIAHKILSLGVLTELFKEWPGKKKGDNVKTMAKAIAEMFADDKARIFARRSANFKSAIAGIYHALDASGVAKKDVAALKTAVLDKHGLL